MANIVDIFCFSPIATPTDPTDDQMRFIINVTGTGVAADYTVSTTQNGNPITLLPDDQGTYATDELFRTQNGLAGNGDLAITITDNVTAGCTFNITITDPNTCSSACTITPTATALACDDNGTNTDPADDTFDVIVAATAVNGGTQFTVSNGATLLGTFDYATGGTIIGLPADGSTITLTFADATDNTCTATADVSQTSCSDTDPCVLPKCMRVTLTKK